MKNVLHPQNVLPENAPPRACGHDAVAGNLRRVRTTLCLARNWWFVPQLSREQAHLFTAGRWGRCCDAPLELARIYFPQ